MKLDMVGIIVTDMQKSLDFYRLLGFNLPTSANLEDYVELDQGCVRLSFNTKKMVTPIFGETTEVPQGQRIELAFLCESSDELNQLHEAVVTRGYQSVKAPWDAFWGQRYCVLEDPDGNLISLFFPLD